jgi:hypothetical protein
MTNVTEAATRQYLYANVTAFNAIHREMYRQIQGQALADSYTEPNILATRYDMPDSGNLGTYQRVNLFQAGLGIAASAAEIAMLPMTNISSERAPPVAYVLVNAVSGGISHEGIHSSLELGYAMSLDTRDIVEANSQGVYIAMSAILAFIAVFVFTPILLAIEGAKDAIVKRFVYLPQLVRLTLQKQAEKRLRALRRNYSEDDEDDDDDLGEDEEAAAGGMDENGDDDEVDWDRILTIINNTANAQAAKRAAAAAPKSSSASVHPVDGSGSPASAASAGGRGVCACCRKAPPPPPADTRGGKSRAARHAHKRKLPAFQKGMSSIFGLFAKFLGESCRCDGRLSACVRVSSFRRGSLIPLSHSAAFYLSHVLLP